MKFNELGLSEKVLNAVETAGYDTPTPIQAQAIPYALEGRDVLGIAQTGTGKTAAFTLPMLTALERGRAKARMPRTLILEPTRELAAQVEEAFIKYGVNHKLNIALLIGGVSDGEQKTKIDRGADVVIATPGRLLDLTERGGLLLTGIEILVIDEADRMLDMGFIPDIERICKLVPFTRQTLFFSATMPPEITRLTEAFLHNPARVEVARAASTAENITQTLVPSGGAPHDKRATLRRIIQSADDFKNAIIFCNRKRDVQVVYRSLEKHAFSVGALHGDLDQRARTMALDAFRGGQVQLLVCSDVAARGLDIPDVSHVINYDAPHHSEDYVHRIGRTGRAGKSGRALTIVTRADGKAIAEIEKLIARKIDWLEGAVMPTAEEEAESNARGERSERGGRRGERSGERGGRRREERAGDAPPRADRQGERAAAPRRRAAQERPLDEQRTDRPVDRGADFRRHRAERPTHERAAEEPRTERPVEPATESRRHRAERPPQERVAAEQERNRERAQRHVSAGGAKRERPRRDDDAPVIGLGDHVPSFLLRPVPKRSHQPQEPESVTED
ncbi:superfamily II DNA/RNA helicase [Roseiarcus fermentans]|uniref:DEAD-box ATP-dependent RNA helicase RhpA n=1 Tax=Roseiarcus fermentans TaxID=1473586 RepID=A0A366F4Y0_9HYPH|nr:DEAD/DEAH box helicase [Roseiarcus fermentans]RBP09698.1 superfamily II DNA/RNA helicase [Roseiarcus fermentans]